MPKNELYPKTAIPNQRSYFPPQRATPLAKRHVTPVLLRYKADSKLSYRRIYLPLCEIRIENENERKDPKNHTFARQRSTLESDGRHLL